MFSPPPWIILIFLACDIFSSKLGSSPLLLGTHWLKGTTRAVHMKNVVIILTMSHKWYAVIDIMDLQSDFCYTLPCMFMQKESVCLKCVAVLRSEHLHAFISDVHWIDVVFNVHYEWWWRCICSDASNLLHVLQTPPASEMDDSWNALGFFEWTRRIDSQARANRRGFPLKNKTSTRLLKLKCVSF